MVFIAFLLIKTIETWDDPFSDIWALWTKTQIVWNAARGAVLEGIDCGWIRGDERGTEEMVESEWSFFFLKRRRILKILRFRNGGAPNFSVALKTCIFRRYKRSFGVHLPQKMKLSMCAKSGPNWCWFRWDMIETSLSLFSLRILIKGLTVERVSTIYKIACLINFLTKNQCYESPKIGT